jgi:hypothetical protein
MFEPTLPTTLRPPECASFPLGQQGFVGDLFDDPLHDRVQPGGEQVGVRASLSVNHHGGELAKVGSRVERVERVRLTAFPATTIPSPRQKKTTAPKR